MKFKIRLNLAMCYVLLIYLYYTIRNFNSIVFVCGALFFIGWICISDLYYIIEKGNLVAYRVIGAKQIRLKDITVLTDPMPVMHRLNPRPGTLAIYYGERKKLHVHPKDQAGFSKAMSSGNKKMTININSLKKKDEK